MARPEFDLVIIGGGSAGLSLAGITGFAGMKVALVERDRLGGECLHAGCVPSKALLSAAHLVHRARAGRRLGLPGWEVGPVRLADVMNRVGEVVDRLQVHDSPEALAAWGVAEFIPGAARFLDSRTIEVSHEGSTRRIGAERFAICTGSRPSLPSIPGLDGIDVWTNENLFEQRELPARLLVLGGGPIGCEMAQAFSRLGAEVSIFELQPRLLPGDDPESSALLAEVFEREGIQLHLGCAAERVEKSANGVVVRACEGVAAEGDAVLVALGRAPAVNGLDLEAAGVRYDRRGVDVDRGLRTTARNIWCLGDAHGGYNFSHVAEYEARTVAGSILLGIPARVDYSEVPWTTFTDPEVAHTGLSEAEARRRHRRVRVLRFPMSRVDRAQAEESPDGFVKVIAAGLRGRVVGAEIVAAGAGELINEWSLAIRLKATASQVSNLVHVYPTLSMANQRAADGFLTDSPPARWAAGLMRSYFRWWRRNETPWDMNRGQ
jgi:pyruvate/2-oxoglutarate dehydrogenase complex dihydrolipoamide dehydrogenase (E3) component